MSMHMRGFIDHPPQACQFGCIYLKHTRTHFDWFVCAHISFGHLARGMTFRVSYLLNQSVTSVHCSKQWMIPCSLTPFCRKGWMALFKWQSYSPPWLSLLVEEIPWLWLNCNLCDIPIIFCRSSLTHSDSHRRQARQTLREVPSAKLWHFGPLAFADCRGSANCKSKPSGSFLQNRSSTIKFTSNSSQLATKVADLQGIY